MYKIYYEYLNEEKKPFLTQFDKTINEVVNRIAELNSYESINDIKILKIKKV